jgi:2-isopropylmalate synthase
MQIHPRHPYAGELVFTAFSGSHQDAISKGLAYYNSNNVHWNVPYLPIDPSDIGRSYDAVIRINSQSGKGGAAYVMESVFGFQIPKIMYTAFGAAVKHEADVKGRELTNTEVYECFQREFNNCNGPYSIVNFVVIPSIQNIRSVEDECQRISISAEISVGTVVHKISGDGNGIISALTNALEHIGVFISVKSFHEHSITEGSDAKAVAYISIEDQNSNIFHGVGIDSDVTTTSLKALINSLNKMQRAT